MKYRKIQIESMGMEWLMEAIEVFVVDNHEGRVRNNETSATSLWHEYTKEIKSFPVAMAILSERQ